MNKYQQRINSEHALETMEQDIYENKLSLDQVKSIVEEHGTDIICMGFINAVTNERYDIADYLYSKANKKLLHQFINEEIGECRYNGNLAWVEKVARYTKID